MVRALSMRAIDFILNLAALLLWLSWRSMRFDPLFKSTPVTLVGTLKRAEPRRVTGWQLAGSLFAIVFLRAILYRLIGADVNWTPKLNLQLVVLAFRSDLFLAAMAFSCLSLLRFLVVFYFWLLVLAILNRKDTERDAIHKLVKLHLGRIARWPWPIQLVMAVLLTAALWIVLHPLLTYLQVIAPAQSKLHLLEQGLLVGLGLFLSLQYVLPTFLVLHLIASYVYLGKSPVWDFVSLTAGNLMLPLRRLPLRFARVDFTPVLAALLIVALLHWLPNLLLSNFANSKVALWPQ